VTVAAGEPLVRTEAEGSGGRNTHAALLAASHLAGTGSVFAAFATDGVDGNSDAAGAIVDGETTRRGGDPTQALEAFDSASYLEMAGDILKTGPTGTNVADLWLIWKPDGGPEPILAP
jgi:glycerate 2-kinase